jgi:hypothetical protein
MKLKRGGIHRGRSDREIKQEHQATYIRLRRNDQDLQQEDKKKQLPRGTRKEKEDKKKHQDIKGATR